MVDLLLHLFCVCTGISWNRSEITTFSPVLRSIFFRLVSLFSFGFFFLVFWVFCLKLCNFFEHGKLFTHCKL